MNEPRVYRFSVFLPVFIILIFGILGFALLATFGRGDKLSLLPLGIPLGIAFLLALHFMTLRTIVSDTEITTQSILGSKTLRWSEINQVSGRGYGIKLHNLDGDVTIAPSPSLPKYEEIVEWIGIKRPDLFAPREGQEMSRSWCGSALALLLVLLIPGTLIYLALQSGEAWIALIFFVFIGIILLITAFSTPQSVTLEGDSLHIKYLSSRRTLSRDEVLSVQLSYHQSRNGKIYFILLHLANGKSQRISGLDPGLPIIYLTLRHWLNKQAGNPPLFAGADNDRKPGTLL